MPAGGGLDVVGRRGGQKERRLLQLLGGLRGLGGFEVGVPLDQVAGLPAIVLPDRDAPLEGEPASVRPGGQVQAPSVGAWEAEGGLEGGGVLRAQQAGARLPELHPVAAGLDRDPCRPARTTAFMPR